MDAPPSYAGTWAGTAVALGTDRRRRFLPGHRVVIVHGNVVGGQGRMDRVASKVPPLWVRMTTRVGNRALKGADRCLPRPLSTTRMGGGAGEICSLLCVLHHDPAPTMNERRKIVFAPLCHRRNCNSASRWAGKRRRGACLFGTAWHGQQVRLG